MRSVKTPLALCIAILAGCSSTMMTHGTPPCMRASPPVGCGTSCGAGTACPSGLYCDSSSHCTADCGGGTACATGQTCGHDGRCSGGSMMDGGPGGDGGFVPMDYGTFDSTCASVMLTTSRMPPNVILVVDRSGSMDSDFGGMSRWNTLYNALMSSPGGLVYSLQDSARFGFVSFTGEIVPFIGGTCPDLATVLPPVLHNYDAINAVYMPESPGTNTPTGESLDSVITTLEGMTLEPGPTIIVLCTDGEPNTCAGAGTDGQPGAIAAASRAAGVGYTLDAIGVASGVSLANLSMVAAAGGGTAVSVSDTASLVTALTTIVGGAVSCTLALSGMIDPTMACGGDVELNGTPLACGDPNGWDAIDMGHIELRGTACDTLLHTTGATVSATFPCGVILH